MSKGVDLEQEDNAAGYLGVTLERDNESGLFELKQTGLIDRVIEALGLDACTTNGKATLAKHAPLMKDANEPEAHRYFSYMHHGATAAMVMTGRLRILWF